MASVESLLRDGLINHMESNDLFIKINTVSEPDILVLYSY